MSEILRTNNDYAYALLKLMDKLSIATKAEVINSFGEINRDRILPEHWAIYKSRGEIIWQNWVAWARARLVQAGLMGKGGYGIWVITDVGRKWIQEHPDVSNRNILELYRICRDARSADNIGEKYSKSNKVEILRWQNKEWSVNTVELINRVEQVMANKPPQEAVRYTKWYIPISDYKISPKWLFHLITGVEFSDFDSPTARRKLRHLGFEAVMVDKSMDHEKNVSNQATGVSARMDKNIRDEFLLQVAELVTAMLPQKLRHMIPKHRSGTNYIQFKYPEFPGLHYEFILARKGLKIAVHFESSRELNLSRLGWIEPHVNSISHMLGRQIEAKRLGKNWASVQTEIPYSEFATWRAVLEIGKAFDLPDNLPENESFIGVITADILSKYPGLDMSAAEDYVFVSAILTRFIDATYEYVDKAMRAFPSGRKRRRSQARTKPGDEKNEIYRRVDEQVKQMQKFLAGRLSNRPSDEQLCDWVHFCYQIGLYEEGTTLFDYIDSQNLDNDWLYKRTKKYAQVCRLNSGPNRR